MTTVEKALQERFSCRKFLPRPVPRDTIESILRAAQMTPSWCNTQPWQITLLSGAQADRLRETLYTHAKSGAPANPDFAFPPRYEGIYRDRRKVCGVQLYESLGIGKEDRAAAAEQALENFSFFGAPHTMLITTPENLGFTARLIVVCMCRASYLSLANTALTPLPRRRWQVIPTSCVSIFICPAIANSYAVYRSVTPITIIPSTVIAPSEQT